MRQSQKCKFGFIFLSLIIVSCQKSSGFALLLAISNRSNGKIVRERLEGIAVGNAVLHNVWLSYWVSCCNMKCQGEVAFDVLLV